MVRQILDELINRWNWSKGVDRIGPDLLYSHVLSYAPKLYKQYCQEKFGGFGEGAELRPGVIVNYCSNVYVGKM